MKEGFDYRLPHLVGLRHVREHVLWLRFSDGLQGEVDLTDGLTGELLEPLPDAAAFAQARIEDGHLAWPNRGGLVTGVATRPLGCVVPMRAACDR